MYTSNPDFYPTPIHLIQKILDKVDFKYIESILEPSAGKGDIVDYIKQKEKYYNIKYDIDCIEANQNLRHILEGKKYRVVYNDFLTYNTRKEYDIIIMNPPFSNGCKHILKALEMQQNGGKIACILNAETLKNPYTNERKDLQRKLTEYNAKVEFIQDAFINAERKTDVEIALIYVDIPQTTEKSFIFDGLKKAAEAEETKAEQSTELITDDYIKNVVKQYEMEVEAGIKLIKEYRAMTPYIMREFGKDEKTGEIIQTGGCILSMDLSRNYNKYNNTLSINNYIREVRGKYWNALFNNENFVGLLTNNLKTEFYNRVEELKDYDFSLYNIYTLKIQMIERTSKGVEDTIISLFEELSNKYSWMDQTSKNIHYYNGWKTNKAWKINKKVIIPLSGYSQYFGNYEPTYYTVVEKLSDIEKCFNYLDGGKTDDVNIKESLQFAEEYGETKDIQLKYFTVTFYKKGSCHIVFNDDELLKKFNIFGSQKKGWLPPSYGKKAYKDMTTEEKAVINDFEGETEYNKTMQNQQYYLFDSRNILKLDAAE